MSDKKIEKKEFDDCKKIFVENIQKMNKIITSNTFRKVGNILIYSKYLVCNVKKEIKNDNINI